MQPTSTVSENITAGSPPNSSTSTQILNRFVTSLKTGGTPRQTSDWDYIQNGTHIPLTGSMLVIGTKAQNGMGSAGSIKDNDITQVTQPFIQNLATQITAFFVTQGFTKNMVDSSTTFDEMNTMRVEFSKDKTLCVVSLSSQSDPFGYVICGIADTAQQKLQQEFSSLIDPKDSKNSGYVFRVQKVDGNYAQGYISNVYGTGWYAKKTNGTWAIVIQTPDLPLCADIQKYSIPKSLYNQCYTPEKQQ